MPEQTRSASSLSESLLPNIPKPKPKTAEPRPSTVQFENVDYFLDLGTHIAYYRRKKGYTQKTLAKRVGISASYLSKIESENQTISFSVNTFFSICRELETDPEKMFKPLP